ncbi:MAG: PASTA domain-containing protein [Bacteroidia bacterium]|nr:PASTA domain-containing protein [Bacteroidia bacterium]
MLFKEKTFWLHASFAFVSVLAITFGIHLMVSSYTDHNVTYTVPNLKGLKISSMEKSMPHPSIEVVITDSVYDPKSEPGIVIRQEPYAGEKIKKNRKIYVITTTLRPPRISMPKLTDLSARQARIILQSYGLKCGSIIEKPADCKGCIVEQLFNGKPIAPGTPIEKGSTIHLVVGTKSGFQALDSIPVNDSL